MSAATAFDYLLDALRDHGSTVRETGDGRAMATCPSHEDRNPSLSIGPRSDGKGVVLRCHAGCDYRDVLAALDMHPRDLFDEEGIRAIFAPSRTYGYSDGRRVHRKPDKTFPQSGNTRGSALFGADRIGDAPVIFWPEGEKDVEAIEAAGGFAVCSAMGAGKAHLADPEPVRGRHVVVVADRDEPGYRHAAQVAQIVRPIAASVSIVEAATGKDAADHIAAGRSLDEFVPVPEAEPVDGANCSMRSSSSRVRSWRSGARTTWLCSCCGRCTRGLSTRST
uniref:Toprim domain-containing protein n=1 Tax=Mycobacterium sp. (strain MCS) TaxID=164756 RepID=A0A5Q5BPD1_MYCSS